MTYLLQTNQLSKNYKGNSIVQTVNMKIKKGEIYGLLGPNGAGKTTIMKMITNLVKPTNGEIEIFGEKLTDTSYELLKRMGSIIESPVFYDKLTAYENLDLHCEYMGYYDKKIIKRTLDLVGLKDIDKKPVKKFSLGMKQRLGIARAIVTKPELLILDEPINGLDPVGIKEIRELLLMLSKEYNITILISSHILGEIEQMADTIGVINHGKLIKEVTMEHILKTHSQYIELDTPDPKKTAFVIEEKLNLSNYRVLEDGKIRIYDADADQQHITKTLILNNIDVNSIVKKTQSLEDYFLNLINGGAGVA
ncbi:ABC transporter ATP-binding protein [Bacillus sp. 03113]|uniref:ABC transporter ATP-binding protein n=1 Tax=Bacillus sp. 03113 TaxID=2578211 RepID=UPI001142ABFB|nr:ABC transporter ATP-binding protein [Bacillus sp. 03113]